MKRVNYHLPEKQIAALRKLSKDTGLAVADLIRRAIEEYLAAGVHEVSGLVRFGTIGYKPPKRGSK
jgi:hypothetical protein